MRCINDNYPVVRTFNGLASHEFVPHTNADRVRSLNNEELAEFINFVFSSGVQRTNSSQHWREWLKQPKDDEWFANHVKEIKIP